MSNVDPFADRTPHARAAQAEQQAAIDAMRAKQMNAKGPTVFFPFGKQQPLAKYAGMQVVPFQKNRFVDRPELILEHPEPGAHYGWVKKDDPEIRGKLRFGTYEAIYISDLKSDNDAAISTEDVMTEAGPNKLVLWHGLMMVKISQQSWYENYELPALMSTVRLTQHQESFNDFTMPGPSGESYRDMRGKAQIIENTMTAG